MPLRLLVPFPVMVDDSNVAELAKFRVNSMCLCGGGSLQSLLVILATQVGLVGFAREADHAARFTDVNVVVEATGIIATTSRIQEGATDSDHGGLDREQKVWRGSGKNLYPAPVAKRVSIEY